MSELTTAARPYARAVFAYASEHDDIKQWSHALNLLAAVVYQPKMKKLLDNPRLNWKQAADMILQVCEGELTEPAQNFVRLLAERGRILLTPEIAALFQHYYSRAQGVIEAQVISATEISDQQLSAITQALSRRLGKNVTVKTSIDRELLGGAVIKAGDLVIDGSIKGRLDKLGSALIN
jgi:F-type H+-transporting ATPase subunit delta